MPKKVEGYMRNLSRTKLGTWLVTVLVFMAAILVKQSLLHMHYCDANSLHMLLIYAAIFAAIRIAVKAEEWHWSRFSEALLLAGCIEFLIQFFNKGTVLSLYPSFAELDRFVGPAVNRTFAVGWVAALEIMLVNSLLAMSYD